MSENRPCLATFEDQERDAIQSQHSSCCECATCEAAQGIAPREPARCWGCRRADLLRTIRVPRAGGEEPLDLAVCASCEKLARAFVQGVRAL